MTLCIGALAQDRAQQSIVLCFDSKVSAEEFSSETEYKFASLSGQLSFLFAGSSGRAKELAWMYREFLKEAVLDKQSVVEQIRIPIARFKRRLADAYLGRTLGLSYDEVLAKGKDWFGKDFQRRLLCIEQHPLRVDLIFAGFIEHFPVLCELRNGELEWKTSFSAIGTGAYTAEPAIHSRNQADTTPLVRTMYNVYEAKRFGESSPFVGKQTTMIVLHPPDASPSHMRIDLVTEEGWQFLDSLFAEYGPKTYPEDVQWKELPKEALIRAR
jgi:hypothetical protein